VWPVEVPAFDVFTKGRTKREAFAMAKDLIETMAGTSGGNVFKRTLRTATRVRNRVTGFGMET
jgi:hypothetical protein